MKPVTNLTEDSREVTVTRAVVRASFLARCANLAVRAIDDRPGPVTFYPPSQHEYDEVLRALVEAGVFDSSTLALAVDDAPKAHS